MAIISGTPNDDLIGTEFSEITGEAGNDALNGDADSIFDVIPSLIATRIVTRAMTRWVAYLPRLRAGARPD
ncbi:hypothetical protein [Leptolyngbya sp. 7M]|uniref:hypothetical protein n=1 Tax=Leptolyngbya sp. 7M TaxID=2812896 RepID=UPI001B8B80E1|nr:hypothetical protein [Leptolyngbya sp. 7M]QYO63266.1 hypothetical protein JVX88_25500 [Leptolyngbya sp. 7M]